MTDVHDIVDQLSVMLQRAVIIEDKNFELVAYSSPDELSFDSLQQKTILTKRCPLFVIERLKKKVLLLNYNMMIEHYESTLKKSRFINESSLVCDLKESYTVIYGCMRRTKR